MRYKVKLDGLQERVVEAGSRDAAVGAYNRLFGVIRSVHQHEVYALSLDFDVPTVASEPEPVLEAPQPGPDASDGKGEPSLGSSVDLSVLGIHPNGQKRLVAYGLDSIEKIRAFLADGHRLCEVDGIKEGYGARIIAKLEELNHDRC